MWRFAVVAVAVGACTVDRSIPDPSTCPRRSLFVNFESEQLSPGDHDDPDQGISTNVTAPRLLPGYRANDPARDTAIQAMVDQIRMTLNSFPIDVVTERPTTAGYHMVLVGGHASDVNPLLDSSLVALGTSGDCVIGAPNAITFVFADALDDLNGAMLPQDGNLVVSSYASTKAIPGSTGDPKDCMATENPDPNTACRTDQTVMRDQRAGACGEGSTFEEFGAFASLPCD